MSHKLLCKARGCRASVALGDVMCARHWSLVPPELQREIREHQSREGGFSAFASACEAAKSIVAEAEFSAQSTKEGAN